MSITAEDFKYVGELARRTAALVLGPGKEYLVETRLASLTKQNGCNSVSELIALMRKDRSYSALHASAIDALTTNETFFFRDFHPFEALRKQILPAVIEKRSTVRKLTIWSAACSSGQEPYSIAMLIREHFPLLAGWQVSILATDFSPTILQQARSGSYNQFEVNRGLSAPLLVKNFTKQADRWVIKEDVRRMIDFRELNLIQPWPILPAFDVIFIRNVMIYFDVPTKQSILKRLRGCILPHGTLFLGTAETTMNLDTDWLPVPFGNSVAYQPKQPASATL